MFTNESNQPADLHLKSPLMYEILNFKYKKEIERNIWRDLQINKTSIRKFFINPQPQSLVNLKKPTRILIVKFDTPVNTFLAVN